MERAHFVEWMRRWDGERRDEMQNTPDWDEIRAGLRRSEPGPVLQVTTIVGRIRAEELPEDIADSVIDLFRHKNPEIRAEAARAIGVHWRLSRSVVGLTALVEQDDDSHVCLYAIGGLGALGVEYSALRCITSRTLARVVLNERFDEYARMVAYLELLRVEDRIGYEEYMTRDRDIPDSLAEFDIDSAWARQLARQECASL